MSDIADIFGDSDDEDFYGFDPEESDSEDDEVELEDLAEVVNNRGRIEFNWSEETRQVNVPSFTQNVGPLGMPTGTASPLAFFSKLFSPRLIQLLVIQTNLFMMLTSVRYDANLYDAEGEMKFTMADEMSAFLGVIILIGIVKLPSFQLYWSQDPQLHQVGITSVFPRQRFETLLRYFHCFDPRTAPEQDDPDLDKLFRIRPVVDILLFEFATKYNPSRYLSIDEANQTLLSLK